MAGRILVRKKRLHLLILMVLSTAGHCAAGPQQVSIPSLDGRLKIPGCWFQADAPGRRPAVISLHGCGGALDAQGRLGAARSREAGYFNGEKMHFLVPDSFTPRGLKSICATANAYRTVYEEDRREDVSAAIQWLAAHVGAVPLGENGRARYEHYLGLTAPKAFVITEKGGWYFSSSNTDAMRAAMERCEKAGVKCWLYAVDERVVWQAEAAARIDSAKLQPKP